MKKKHPADRAERRLIDKRKKGKPQETTNVPGHVQEGQTKNLRWVVDTTPRAAPGEHGGIVEERGT